MLWNHGSEKLPGWLPQLGPVFARQGYVFFVPHRRGHGRSPGEYIQDLLERERREKGTAAWSRLLVKLHETDHLNDQIAALSYLKSLPQVDPERIAVAGLSFGGIQTVLAAERDLGIKAAVNFAGAAETWASSPDLRDRLLKAVRQTSVPILFIQAKNDYDLTAGDVLAAEMARLNKPHKRVIFPPFGTTAQSGHSFGVQGVEIWASEVFSFIGKYIGK